MTDMHDHTPLTAFANVQPCQLVSYHAPKPVMTEYHHTKPVFLQNRVYGKIVYGADLYVCSSCHDSIHAWLYWLLGEHRQPEGVGRAAKTSAEATFKWYTEELRSSNAG